MCWIWKGFPGPGSMIFDHEGALLRQHVSPALCRSLALCASLKAGMRPEEAHAAGGPVP